MDLHELAAAAMLARSSEDREDRYAAGPSSSSSGRPMFDDGRASHDHDSTAAYYDSVADARAAPDTDYASSTSPRERSGVEGLAIRRWPGDQPAPAREEGSDDDDRGGGGREGSPGGRLLDEHGDEWEREESPEGEHGHHTPPRDHAHDEDMSLPAAASALQAFTSGLAHAAPSAGLPPSPGQTSRAAPAAPAAPRAQPSPGSGAIGQRRPTPLATADRAHGDSSSASTSARFQQQQQQHEGQSRRLQIALPSLTFDSGTEDNAGRLDPAADGSSDSSTAHSTPECASAAFVFAATGEGEDEQDEAAGHHHHHAEHVVHHEVHYRRLGRPPSHSASPVPGPYSPSSAIDGMQVPPKKQKGRRPNIQTMETKTHKCPFDGCAWSFSRREHLKRHEKTHTMERPFTCDVPLCGLKFSRLDNLNSHKRTHEKGKRTAQWHVAKVMGGSVSPIESNFPGLDLGGAAVAQHKPIPSPLALATPTSPSFPPLLSPALSSPGSPNRKRKRPPIKRSSTQSLGLAEEESE